MSVWFIDGFDHYSDFPYAVPPAAGTADLLKKWSATNMAPAGGWIGSGFARQQPGQGIKFSNSNYITKVRPGTNVDTYIIGMAFQMSVVNVANTLLTFLDTTEQMSIRTDTNGHLTLNKNSATPTVTSTNTLSAGTWYYLEAKIKINNTTGTYEARINGSAAGWIAAATGQNTRTTANNQLTSIQVGPMANITTYVDDFYAADATGTANIDFLGPQVIWTARPVGAGNYAQFTPNYGNNFGNVNEIYADADASFNQSTTAGHRDSFKSPQIPFQSGAITAYQQILYARQDSGAQRVMRPFMRTGGGVDRDGNNVNLSSSYQMILEPHDVNPDTGAAMTIAEWNAAEFGYNLVS